MSNNANAIRSAKLGMPVGTASAKLRKSLLFALVVELGVDLCYRCGLTIETERDLSIEHKTPWQNSQDPVGNFFDLDNISFSHLVCNIKAADRPWKKYASFSEQKNAGWARYYTRPEKREAHLARKRRVYAVKRQSVV